MEAGAKGPEADEAVESARRSNSTFSRRLQFKTRNRADLILDNFNHPPCLGNGTLAAYMSIPPEQYVTFDENVLKRGKDGTFHFNFPIPTHLFKGVDMRVVKSLLERLSGRQADHAPGLGGCCCGAAHRCVLQYGVVSSGRLWRMV